MRDAVQDQANLVAGRLGMTMPISYFENLGCEKAQGRIGYQCDFLVRYSNDNAVAGFANIFIGEGNAMRTSGRFVQRGGQWTYLPEQNND